MFDLVIKNGQIVDGSGKAAFYGDVAVKDGEIVKIASQITEAAGEEIDAGGLQVTPGFIDNHCHSDRTVFTGSDSWNYLEQGVTTQIAGQCGTSPAPFSEEYFYKFKAGCDETELTRRKAVSATPSSFMEEALHTGFGTNKAFFIGHSALRSNAMGFSDAKPDRKQMEQMKANIRLAMEAGYLGYSSGLEYAPSVYADTEELTELAGVLTEYGGIYASHIRGEGDTLLEAVKEAISVGENSGCDVLISHLKVCGKHNEGKSGEVLKEIDRAVARGVNVWADQYPYLAASAPLNAQLPPSLMVGGIEAFLERIAVPENRCAALDEIFHDSKTFESCLYTAGFEGSLISAAEKTPQYVNRTVAQIAADEGKEPIDAVCDLLLANDGIVQGIYFSQNPTDLLRIMGHKRVFCGSDWSELPDRKKDREREGGCHPRATSTMVRRLELVRDFRLRTMEESVKNLSFDTARAMHLPGIGLVAEGWNADLCVLDYDRLHAVCDYKHPYRKNQGIHWTVVNGRIAVKDGSCLGVRAGKALKRRGC